jgi:hypothetical protein
MHALSPWFYTAHKGGTGMQTVAIRVRPMDLSAVMAAMRKWLDERRCEPSNFKFRRSGDSISICAVFGSDADGEAFKARFDGRTQGREPDSVAEDLKQLLAQESRR